MDKPMMDDALWVENRMLREKLRKAQHHLADVSGLAADLYTFRQDVFKFLKVADPMDMSDSAIRIIRNAADYANQIRGY